MEIDARMLVHRILKRMARFSVCDGSSLPERYRNLSVPPGHVPLGVYENEPTSVLDALVVTDRGIVLCATDSPLVVEFRDIADATWTPESKRRANAVRLTLRSGEFRDLPVRGSTAEGADVFEFVRFVMRAKASVGADV